MTSVEAGAAYDYNMDIANSMSLPTKSSNPSSSIQFARATSILENESNSDGVAIFKPATETDDDVFIVEENENGEFNPFEISPRRLLIASCNIQQINRRTDRGHWWTQPYNRPHPMDRAVHDAAISHMATAFRRRLR